MLELIVGARLGLCYSHFQFNLSFSLNIYGKNTWIWGKNKKRNKTKARSVSGGSFEAAVIIPLHGPAVVTESPGWGGRVAGIPLDYTEVGHCPQATPEGVPRVAPEGAASLLSLEPLGRPPSPSLASSGLRARLPRPRPLAATPVPSQPTQTSGQRLRITHFPRLPVSRRWVTNCVQSSHTPRPGFVCQATSFSSKSSD